MEEDAVEPPTAADESNAEGIELLRSLPAGVGGKLAGHAVERWAPVVAAALRSGMAKNEVIDKLTSGLPEGNVDQRVRIVVGRRLPDLKTTVEQAPRRSAERAQSETEKAHTKIDRLAERGAAGAREAAGLLGLHFDPEAQRGNVGAQEWLLQRLPALSREFVEQHRKDLIAVFTSRRAA